MLIEFMLPDQVRNAPVPLSPATRPALADTEDSRRKTAFLINDVGRLLRRDLDRRLHHLGLTQTQWRALAQISRRQGIIQAELAEILEVTPMALARLVDRMEAAGWVQRQPHPADRRAMQLVLTEKADPVLTEIREIGMTLFQDVMGGVPEQEQRRLARTLERMKQNLLCVEAAAQADQQNASNE